MGFVQYIDKSTHRSGGIIDHLYIFRPAEHHNVVINWDLYSAFYSDHFGISIIINKGENVFRKMQSSIPDEVNSNSSANSGKQKKQTNKQPSTKEKRKRISTTTPTTPRKR